METDLALTGENYTRIPGVSWTPKSAGFLFVTDFPKIEKKLMSREKILKKREVSKVLMSFFDPLGLLTVITIQTKIMVQDIRRLDTGWDEEIPEDLHKK